MKINKNKRALVFWLVCIPTRVYLANVGDSVSLRTAAAVVGTRWLKGLENGNEGFFGGVAWWAGERPIHGALWSSYAVTGNSNFLKADVIFGIANWFNTFF